MKIMMKVIDCIDKTSTVVGEMTKPHPKEGEVLVKIAYSALDTAFEEVAHRSLIPGSLLHNLKVKPLVAGWHYSGTVESIGDGVKDFQVGDSIFGHLQYASSTKQGSLAEYISVPELECAKVPEGVTMEVAAAVTTEALTALQAMRDQGKLAEGKSILIIAAGGGVGTQAVQIAKAMQAHIVDAVCSTKDVSRVEKLGASCVIDRTQKDINTDLQPASYDVIFDTTGKYSFMKLRYALKKKGSLVSTIPNISTIPPASLLLAITGKRSKSLFVHCNRKDLELVGQWMKSGEIYSIPVDNVYDVKDIQAARERQSDPKKSGRVVIKVDGGW
eukprot:CAMPEP_0183717126 /NCGR_PEP_ID=MMETSP0737-20130205/10814_1 /TAXON_ID=385413 /ORGANISM="Thalassiosira miniscula, Strain CCMP1093" /LENGTH=329 /DNA_ID=CAMNT_0025946507 /DNA_START=346 /DNA_END=1335 /DNA_ORIENTATION=-